MKKIYSFLFVAVVMCSMFNLYSMDNQIASVQLRKHVKENDQEKVRILLQEKVDINAFNNEGSNPLIIALHDNNLEMIKILLDYGANPCIEYDRFITREFFHFFSEKELFSAHKYHYPIIEAAKQGNLDCLKMLIIDYNVDPFFVEKNQGWLCFDYLVQKDHQECVKMVLEHVKKIDVKNFSKLSLEEYFQSLPDSGYRDSLRTFIKYLFLSRKTQNNIFSRVPKPVIIMIIKLSIDPYYPMLHELLETKRIKRPFYSDQNVLILAETQPEMKNLLLEYKNLLDIPTQSKKSDNSYISYFCCIS